MNFSVFGVVVAAAVAAASCPIVSALRVRACAIIVMALSMGEGARGWDGDGERWP